jgi:sterol desaturase/sphingolipid hydroxylase (fatty acid hydroxylase superfamily)
MSPAHHQLHHSIETRHLNRNFGVKFPFWDALFGTLYDPKQPETFRVGLAEPEPHEFTSVWRLYILPFVKVVRSSRVPSQPAAPSKVLEAA